MQTSPTVKKFLISLGLISLIIALLQTYLNSDLGGLSPQWLLSLNLNGLSKGFIWQPFTYLFTASHGFQGVSLGLILELLANIYLLWMLSLQILQHFDEKHFFRCFFLSSWIAGIVITVTLFLLPNPIPYAGALTGIFALLFFWTRLEPERKILLFLTVPIKVKWLALGFFSITFLLTIGQKELPQALGLLLGASFGYFYSLALTKFSSPYSFLDKMDDKVLALFQKIEHWLHSKAVREQKVLNKSKVVDLKSGKAWMTEDEFLDTMLQKISESGENSLSWNEKRKLKKLSKKRKEQS
jgi:membrane associated rhomboid family serine protease